MTPIKLTLSEQEAAQALGCSVSTVQTLARQRKVPATRFGDAGWVFPIKPFEEFLNNRAWANMEDPPEPPQTSTQQLHNILFGPGPIGNAVEAKPKGPPKLVPLVEPPEVAPAFGPRSWSTCG